MSKENQSEVLLVIPAYNEAESIERVVDELIVKYPELDYVVVLDGPTDGTDEICRRRGYKALYLPDNLGLTGCFHEGMLYASREGYDYAVQFDGDGQHRPEYILPMLNKAREGYDIVLGSRFLEKGHESIGFMRRIGSGLISLSVRLKTGVRITDPTCGLRMYSGGVIERFAASDSLSPEPDSIAYLISEGLSVAEVPVRVQRREAGVSYLGPIRAARYMCLMLAHILRL